MRLKQKQVVGGWGEVESSPEMSKVVAGPTQPSVALQGKPLHWPTCSHLVDVAKTSQNSVDQ